MRHKDGRAPAIEDILGETTSSGRSVGVYGADVCALCGRVDTFRGWIMATYGCHFGRHGEFVCKTCRDQLIPPGETSIGERNRLVGQALEKSRIRYCRMCEAKIPRHPGWATHRGSLPRVCDRCRRMLANLSLSTDDQIVDALRLAVRRRFLEMLSASELTEMARIVDHMREDLESEEDDSQVEKSDENEGESKGTTETTVQIGFFSYPDPMARRNDLRGE